MRVAPPPGFGQRNTRAALLSSTEFPALEPQHRPSAQSYVAVVRDPVEPADGGGKSTKKKKGKQVLLKFG